MLRRLLLVNLVPVLFLGANLAVFLWTNPLAFQRFGSVGVAAAAVMFGLDKFWRQNLRQSPRAIEQLLRVELSLIVLATLQWGYGDLFHCWIRGHGWTACG